jgi:WD40 repeat protein
MKTFFYITLIASILISCNHSIVKKDSSIKQSKLEIAFVVDENDLIPEGITYDSKTKRFFLSSKSKDKVIAVNPDGSKTDFITTRQDSMLGSLGLKVDVKRRRLWTVSNRVFDDQKVSLVHIFNIDSGNLIKKFFAPSDMQYHLNDLILTKNGAAYITDTQSSRIFHVPSDLNKLTIFMIDSLIYWPNGIAISPNDSLLYVESDYNGILIIDLYDKSINKIGNPMSVETGGIDGLMYYKNSLIGIANSQHENFEYVVRYKLNSNGREIISASIIDKANPEFNTPTTGVIVEDYLYVLASTCLDVYNSNKMNQKDLLKNPLVLKYQLN